MSWKRRRKTKGRNTYYSLSKKLRQDKKINESFLIMINNLSLEEVIGLKLETAGKVVNNRLYGLPIWYNLTGLVKDAIFKYAYSATRTQWEAMRLLGLSEYSFTKFKKKYSPVSYFEEEDN